LIKSDVLLVPFLVSLASGKSEIFLGKAPKKEKENLPD